MDTVDELQGTLEGAKAMADDLAGLLERAPAFMHTVDMDRLMDLVVALDDLKDVLESAKRAINKARTLVDQHACKEVFNHGDINYKNESGTFCASVAGYFTVNDGRKFLKHLDGDVDEFTNMVVSRSALKSHCEERLTNGEPTPPGISQHLEARISIRRKR